MRGAGNEEQKPTTAVRLVPLGTGGIPRWYRVSAVAAPLIAVVAPLLTIALYSNPQTASEWSVPEAQKRAGAYALGCRAVNDFLGTPHARRHTTDFSPYAANRVEDLGSGRYHITGTIMQRESPKQKPQRRAFNAILRRDLTGTWRLEQVALEQPHR